MHPTVRTARIRIETRAVAPLETVWEVLQDQAGMSAWTPARSVRLEREGDPPPNGVGAIRLLSGLGLHAREEITAATPPTHLAYRLVSGLPLRDYRGETHLSFADGTSKIIWTVAFRPRWLGETWLVRAVAGALAKGLAAEAERRATRGSD
jgi:Polyketide cyclase / dehydrase and lipid transport